MRNAAPIAVRLSLAVLAQVDDLARELAVREDMPVTRSDVVRRLIVR